MSWPVTPLAFASSTPQFQVSRSLRFDGVGNVLANANRFEGNRQKFTQSLWIKRTALGTNSWLTFLPSATSVVGLYLQSDDTLVAFVHYNTTVAAWQGLLCTQQPLRDTSSWYHINLAVDTTQDIPQNRIKLSINGSTVTAFLSAFPGAGTNPISYPPQNTLTNFNTKLISYDATLNPAGGPGYRYIGGSGNAAQYFDGYMSEVNYVDGQALDPMAFGRYDENGMWVPRRYNGNFGPNGYYVPFSDASTRGALGLNANELNTVDPFRPFNVFHLQTRSGILNSNNNTFVDSYDLNRQITRTGNASQGTFNPYSLFGSSAATQGGSVYFDGSSDLGASDGGVLNFGANNYTVEFWVYSVATMNSGSYPTANTGPCFISGNTTLGWAIYNNVTAGKGITIGQGNVTTITDTANSNVPLPTNQWNHIAVSRSSGTLAIWLNGTRILQVGSATNYSGSAPIKIGSFNGVTGGHNVKGYMAGVHILNNVALYDPANATIAVPTAPPAVTASTVCLLNFNNAAVYDAASFFNLDTINGAAASTGQPLSLSNNSCLALGGGTATPCVSSNRFNNYLINFEKNDFTMEAWLWLQTAPTGVAPTENAFIVSAQNNLVNPQTWALYVTPSRTIALLRTTAIITTTVNAIPLQTWVHVAVVRQNNIVTTYLNGVADTSIKVSGNFNTTDSTVAPALVIGRRPPQDSTSRDPFVGLISDLRITRAARYVNDFVPSVSPLPVTGSTQGWWPYTIQVGGNLESDTMVDVPANWGTDNGGTLSSTMRGNYPTISLANKGAGFTVSNGGLDVSSAAAGSIWRPATATHAVSSGKWYWEVVINSTPVGNGIMMGVANTRWDAITENVSVTYPGGDAALNSWGYYINGSMFRGGAAAAYGTSYTASDVIGFALDMDNGTFYASKNGVWQGINNASNPVVSNPSIGRNPINQISGKTFPLTGFHFPAFGVYGGETYVVNFGQRPFVYANALQLSAGFKPICTTNIVPPLRRPGNFFEATSYTGGTNTFNPDPAAGQLVLAMPLDSYNTHFDVSNEISNRISQPKALYTTAGVTYTSISGAAFNGTTGYIELSAHPDFDLGITGNWTIEWYQYWNVLTGFQTVWSNNYVTIPNLLIQSQNNLGRHQLYTNGGTSILNEGNAPTPSLWYHYAVVKNGSTYTIFRNGSATGVTTYNAVTNAGSPTFRPEIGRGNGAFFVNGNIRDFRIYKGWAKYTTTFNPATATTAVVATTGTGFDKFINLGFQPDLVWVKARNIGKTSHILVDSVRGGTSTLSANSSDTATVSSNNITFNQTGFTVGGSKTTTGLLTSFNSQLNTPGATYTAYGWKRNALAGFDIVGFNKLNATNETFNHSLGRIPEMIIVKGINAATNWNVYHSASISTNPASIVTTLNTQAASVIDATMWNNTRPTASQFSLGTVWPAGNYAAYLFAEIPGFSRFGSYTGNASINGSFVWCGFKPRFVLTKKVTGTSDWLIWDSSRGPINPISPHFVVNSNAADQSTTAPTYNGYLDFTATGFKLRLTSAPNDAGEYIFAAFADNPFGRVPGQVLAV